MFNFANSDELKERLITDLKNACKILSQYSGGYSGEFLDAQEFYQALVTSISEFENGDNSKIQNFLIWFAPTTAWDDFVGTEGIELGNSIFKQLENYIHVYKIKI